MTMYTIYKTTNLINGKFYIGAHKTDDPNDEYLGSGDLLRLAFRKYGRQNFSKEVLFIFENSYEMFEKEAEIVNSDFVADPNTYNLRIGGEGGFTEEMAMARLKLYPKSPFFGKTHSEETRKKISGRRRLNPGVGFTGKVHSDEYKKMMSSVMKVRQAGKRNSQFGTRWITNGTINKKIHSTEKLPSGWRYGRTGNN